MATIWQPYEPTAKTPWNWRRVVHLHRRAGFGAVWGAVQRDVAAGPELAIRRVLNGDAKYHRNDFDEMSQVIGDAAVSSGDPNRLKAWWLYRMLFSPHPLREKITLLWHNHFATSNLKVNHVGQMRRQNEILRRHATDKFGELLNAVVKDPAMLVWLDANSNRKGHPNENLARELMELFTLGIGHYTEDDVKNAARALTGWTVKHGEFEWNADRHDAGVKMIREVSKAFNGDDLIKLLLASDATSHRIAWRLCSCFMGEGVADTAALSELTAGLRERDNDIAWAVETILLSQLFFSNENLTSRISSPVEYVVGAVRSLELLQRPPSTLILAEWCKRLGQDLFYPPNVGGWNEGRSWLTSRNIVGRSNFAVALTSGHLRAPTQPPDFKQLIAQYHGDTDFDSASPYFSRVLLGDDMTSDEASQLKSNYDERAGTESLGGLAARILSLPRAYLV